MLAPSSGLLRAGIGLKLNQVKLATRSYLRDRTNQATGTMTSYAVAIALFAAAGIFVIAACLVGIAALFRWIEINYGQFWAFGAVGALLAIIAAVCGGLGAAKLRPATPHFPSLTSRLRVAIRSNPLGADQIEAAPDTAASTLMTPPATPSGTARAPRSRSARNNRNMQAGLIVMATLLGWATARRRKYARQMDVMARRRSADGRPRRSDSTSTVSKEH